MVLEHLSDTFEPIFKPIFNFFEKMTFQKLRYQFNHGTEKFTCSVVQHSCGKEASHGIWLILPKVIFLRVCLLTGGKFCLMTCTIFIYKYKCRSQADPGFPRRGRGCGNLLFGQFPPKTP